MSPHKRLILRDKDVYPHTLPIDQRRIFFEGLKAIRPETAEVLSKDEFIKGLKSRFGAVPVFKEVEAREIYRAGLEVMKNKPVVAQPQSGPGRKT